MGSSNEDAPWSAFHVGACLSTHGVSQLIEIQSRVVPYKVDEGAKLSPVELFVSSFLSSGFCGGSFLKRCNTLFTVDNERRKVSQIWCGRFSSYYYHRNTTRQSKSMLYVMCGTRAPAAEAFILFF